ncbi:MAG: peroxide stress protein YaaA [Lutimonas sp.]
MKILISPAKSLDFETEAPLDAYSEPIFLDKAERLSKVLKKKSARSLSKLMSISDALSKLNYERNQNWHLPFTEENAKQAVYAFTGEVYRGLDATTLPVNVLDDLQDKLRILSGQYGLLKPFDLIQPYRLEMGTKLKVGKKENLYQFWDTSITNALNDEMEEGELLINLASNEYFKAVKVKQLKGKVITPVFKDMKNGKLMTIAIFAKNARGLMVRYIIEKGCEKVDDLKSFDLNGYAFDSNLSSETQLVFTR